MLILSFCFRVSNSWRPGSVASGASFWIPVSAFESLTPGVLVLALLALLLASRTLVGVEDPVSLVGDVFVWCFRFPSRPRDILVPQAQLQMFLSVWWAIDILVCRLRFLSHLQDVLVSLAQL